MSTTSSAESAGVRVATARHTIALPDDFRPSRHGFRFANHFPGLPLPVAIDSLPRSDKLYYGLCGGMCFAVLDYLAAGRTPPDVRHVSDRRSKLFRYIFKRQLDSFGRLGRYIGKFALWMILPDSTVHGTQRRTLTEIGTIRERLDAGQKVMLGVMYNSIRETLVIWQNHQVLAYAYRDLTDELTAYLIYDPNRPGDDTGYILTTRVRLGEADDGSSLYGLRCTQRSNRYADKRVRGIFPMLSYRPQSPPTDL